MSAVVTCALFAGCESDSPAEDMKQAREEHRESLQEAQTINDPEDRTEAMNEANVELAEEYADAREEMAMHSGQVAHPGARDRFEAFRDETDPAFAARARERIAMIDSDLGRMSTTAAQRKGVADSLREAREDLEEFRRDEVFDDGKVGVTTAINSAERKLDRLAMR